MTTKEYLNQIHKYNIMLEAKLEEINALRAMACIITVPTSSEKVKTSVNPDKLTNAVAKIVELEKETDKVIDELIKKRKLIIEQIDAIEVPEYYSFLTYKYVQLLQTKEIMDKMGIAKSAMFRIQAEALEEFGNRYRNEYS